MSTEIKVPSVGESITEGTLVRWLKKAGDQVKLDEPIFELETEKASTEVPAPASGVLSIKVQPGQTVAIGSVVGAIDASKGSQAPPPSPAPPAKTETARSEPAKADLKEKSEPAVAPAARRMAAEEKVDVAAISGSGRRGTVLKEDVQTFVEHRTDGPPEPAAPARAEVAPAKEKEASRESRRAMSAIRARIADRLLAAQKNTASLTTFNEIDMSAVMELRSRYKDRFKEKHKVGLGFMSFFVKASIEALKAYPLVNSRIDGSDIVESHAYHIGVAVSTEKGLMVPVLRDADNMTFAAIEKTLADLAGRARTGKIQVADLQGGTFTITNGGIFGSLLSTPILNPPQSAILGMHTIQKRPVVHDDQIVIRPMMYVALTYDHRIIDGREAVLFLVRIKECIENPERMLLEV